MDRRDIYQGSDPRELPIYRQAQAARYLKIPSATVRSWVHGRSYETLDGPVDFVPLITPPADADGRLSFNNLVEIHVLRALRTRHRAPLVHVRTALEYAAHELDVERLLLHPALKTTGGELFLERYGKLINLSRSGQIALEGTLERYLARIERDEMSMPVRLFPIYREVRVPSADQPAVAIDPKISFGRPILHPSCVSTAVITQRVDAGEDLDEIAQDYGIRVEDIEAAVVYEQAA